MGRHRQTAEITSSQATEEPIARTRLDRSFLRRGRVATARKEHRVFNAEAPDPFAGPSSPDANHNQIPRPNRRRRALAAVAIVAAAGGLAGGIAAFKGSGNAAPKASISASANMFKPMEHAAAKLGAYEKHQQTAEVDQTVNSIANNAASRIVKMTAADAHVRQDPGNPKSGVDMYAWGGNFQHPESEVSVWHDQLTVQSINEPGGPNGKTWNSVKITYRVPESMKNDFNHPMTAADWEQINFGQLQFENMDLQNNSGPESTTLSATHGGYSLGGAPIAKADQLAGFGQGVGATLDRLEQAQAQYS